VILNRGFQSFGDAFGVFRIMKPSPVVPEEFSADPNDSVGFATIFQQIRGYISVMAAFKVTYFLNQRNNVLLTIIEHFNLAIYLFRMPVSISN